MHHIARHWAHTFTGHKNTKKPRYPNEPASFFATLLMCATSLRPARPQNKCPKATAVSHDLRANPCCNGRWAWTRWVLRELQPRPVLILVLVEDGLGHEKWSTETSLRIPCLNPCCNGRWSRTFYGTVRWYWKCYVLILVVMEDGLGQHCPGETWLAFWVS